MLILVLNPIFALINFYEFVAFYDRSTLTRETIRPRLQRWLPTLKIAKG